MFLFFPVFISIFLFVWGLLVLFFSSFGEKVVIYVSRFSSFSIGILWLLIICGLFVSSYKAIDPVTVNLIGIILIFDALSLIFIPSYITRAVIIYRQMGRGYKIFYGLLSILLSLMIVWQFKIPLSALWEMI